jgi:hypothetical protein
MWADTLKRAETEYNHEAFQALQGEQALLSHFKNASKISAVIMRELMVCLLDAWSDAPEPELACNVACPDRV